MSLPGLCLGRMRRPMMGIKIRNFSPLPNLSLEELLPKDNFYRRLEENGSTSRSSERERERELVSESATLLRDARALSR
jgi:hypothetical protein